MWTTCLPRASIDDACAYRDKRDREIDALEGRLDAMGEAERRALIQVGGLAKARKRVCESEALTTWANEFANHFMAAAAELGDADDALAGVETAVFAKRMGDETETIRGAIALFDEDAASSSINDLVAAWQALKQPTPHSATKMKLYARRFEAICGGRVLAKITEEDARRFRDWLQQQPFKASADKHLGAMRRLWKLGKREGLVDGHNPFEDVEAVKQPRREKRRRFYDDEAQALLSALEQQEAQFSLAMRMLYWHGARGKEVLNLTGANIETVSGIACWTVRANAGKNSPSDRIVPLHSKVRDEVLARAMAAGVAPLFNDFPLWGTGRQGAFQKQASRFIRAVVGIKDSAVVTHGLRHYWVWRADNVGIPPNVQRAITGHAPIPDVHGRVYSSPPDVRVLSAWLEKIKT
jgi:integrase